MRKRSDRSDSLSSRRLHVPDAGGFFGVAFLPAFKVLLYTGAALVTLATLVTGVGLIRG